MVAREIRYGKQAILAENPLPERGRGDDGV
jgi:hypothetical protein